MQQQALLADINGVANPLSYGQSANDNLRWDATKSTACVCDSGWMGHACPQKRCPTGDDPLTPGVHEVQPYACTKDESHVRSRHVPQHHRTARARARGH